ncbi:MAG: hypothetical protein ABI887_00880 [Burkholderiales bacterium]
MMTIQYGRTALAIAALLAASGAFGATMSKADYTAAKDRIEAEYKADRTACDTLSGNAKDICKEKAEGKQKVARAELEYSDSGKPADGTKVAITKADAAYAVAKQMCDDKSGNPKDVCVSEAKAARTKALTDARLSEKVGEARKDAAQDKNDADYKVATEKCESLAGDAKASCVSAAKARFNKS